MCDDAVMKNQKREAARDRAQRLPRNEPGKPNVRGVLRQHSGHMKTEKMKKPKPIETREPRKPGN